MMCVWGIMVPAGVTAEFDPGRNDGWLASPASGWYCFTRDVFKLVAGAL